MYFFILCGNKDYYIYIYKTIISGGKQKKKLLKRKKNGRVCLFSQNEKMI